MLAQLTAQMLEPVDQLRLFDRVGDDGADMRPGTFGAVGKACFGRDENFRQGFAKIFANGKGIGYRPVNQHQGIVVAIGHGCGLSRPALDGCCGIVQGGHDLGDIIEEFSSTDDVHGWPGGAAEDRFHLRRLARPGNLDWI